MAASRALNEGVRRTSLGGREKYGWRRVVIWEVFMAISSLSESRVAMRSSSLAIKRVWLLEALDMVVVGMGLKFGNMEEEIFELGLGTY